MVLSKDGSRSQIVNLLSEFILSKIPSESKTIIEIVDCKNFFVVKGKTTHDVVLNMFDTLEEFKTKYSTIIPSDKSIKTIDLIEYSSRFDKSKSISLKFYNTDYPNYSTDQIFHFMKNNISVDNIPHITEIDDDTNFILSNFPYGYSHTCGKSLFQYLRQLSIQVIEELKISEIEFTIHNPHNPSSYEMTINDEISTIELSTDLINQINNDVKNKVDLSFEIINPLSNNTEI
jgi:hypothetical protein